MKCIHFLNPEQTPLLGADWRVNAKLKNSHWIFPENFGKDKFLVMLAGPYIDDKIYQILRTIMHGSMWDWAMTLVKVMMSILDDSHIKRSR